VPYMLNYGKRGILISEVLEEAVAIVITHLNNADLLVEMSKMAARWSQQYTLEMFQDEIKKLIKA